MKGLVEDAVVIGSEGYMSKSSFRTEQLLRTLDIAYGFKSLLPGRLKVPPVPHTAWHSAKEVFHFCGNNLFCHEQSSFFAKLFPVQGMVAAAFAPCGALRNYASGKASSAFTEYNGDILRHAATHERSGNTAGTMKEEGGNLAQRRAQQHLSVKTCKDGVAVQADSCTGVKNVKISSPRSRTLPFFRYVFFLCFLCHKNTLPSKKIEHGFPFCRGTESNAFGREGDVKTEGYCFFYGVSGSYPCLQFTHLRYAFQRPYLKDKRLKLPVGSRKQGKKTVDPGFSA